MRTGAQRPSAGWWRYLADGGEALPAWPILAALCLASAVTMVALGSRLTFFNDDWFFLLQRPGFSAHSLLDPYNGHLNLIPVLTWKALVGLFGLDAQLPFRLTLAALNAALAAVVFMFVRERAGNLLAIVAAALLLFLGPAWEALIFFSPSVLVGSLTAGVASLLALERDSGPRNLLACALLLASVLTSNLGIPFVVAAAVVVAGRRRFEEAWIPGLPALVFGVWWLAYGRDAGQTDITLGHLAASPSYVLNSVSSGLASLSGLTEGAGAGYDPYAWGRPMLALAVLGTIYWLYRGGRPSSFAIAIAAAALTFWILAGADFTPPGDEPTASRYQMVSGTLLILFAAELFRPIRLSPRPLAAIAVLALLAIGSNIFVLKDGYDLLHRQSEITRAALGGLDIAGERAPDDLQLTEAVTGSPFLAGVTAGAYFRETGEHGSPAYSPDEILTASPEARQAADRLLVAAYGLGLGDQQVARRPAGMGCGRLAPAAVGGPAERSLPSGRVRIVNLGAAPAAVLLRRLAPPGAATEIGTLQPGFSALLAIPGDSVPARWRVSGDAPLELCRENGLSNGRR